ncbi:hypothetical protein PHYSODRAFT_522089 [Phytophthora sojae]|uniref:Peptidase A2 domain-containing protein n=1 Tax=Phytophthora sojae (strain P6497) TaxID=1094619 RepID=G5A472_PHYSP|nr:hypothetical protein PHYSODRAFT_522089 [Phytophthora sojae]EGZ09518.1 hypothetical protein PHYSODRAFT_522089 [Phytophthora sojae]|eukprot:XP_009534379.1 hypothetical protein PHYSODRAFT_522089 [Phytophthora sojae]
MHTAIACEDESLLESHPVSRNNVFRGSAFEDEAPVEFTLNPGERYGWWADHDSDNQDAVALVHGAINNYRAHIILDSGASTTILSPDLARRLKLKLTSHAGLKVKGMGGVITYIRSRTRVKLTLGMRVVYVLDMWVGNIGDGVACLLGMDFMKAAGVRLWAREQLAKLPNEEDIPLVGEKEVPRYILVVPICVREPVYLAPGDSIIVPVRYGQADADTAEVWTARGNHWVTQVIYSSRRRPAAVRLVNISEKWTQIMQHTVVAALVEPGQLPRGDRFVQPKTRKYREWQQEIYQNTPSREYRRREELKALEAERNAPPAVLRPQYV